MRHYLVFVVLLSALVLPLVLNAADVTDIQQKIYDQQEKIIQLEKEIAVYEATLTELGKNKSTLESEIKRLDTSRKKIGADISVTQDKISTANLQLERLAGEIGDKELRISLGRSGVSQSLAVLGKMEDFTLIEQYYNAHGIIGFWEDADNLIQLQRDIRTQAVTLALKKAQLTDDRADVIAKKQELSSLAVQLSGQKAVLDQNRKEQTSLLSQTKKSETNFQSILKDKQEARAQFEQQLNEFESQLKYALDPSSIPVAGQGVLSWPLDSSFMARCKDRKATFKNNYCITQFFGYTAFAKGGAYNGSQHNGIDFGSPDGTKVIAALSGTVTATGNTDAHKGCYSYGKWVLVKHANGLSTLYAHLSYISVQKGDSVPTGGMLGYSGKTGYATGPHLHFTLFATDGVQVVRMGDIKAKTNCANATVPVAATSAYLDPLQYL